MRTSSPTEADREPRGRSEGRAGILYFLRFAEGARMGFAISVQEEVVVGHGLLDELLNQEELGAVNDSMDALLKGLHGSEGLKGIAQKENSGVASLAHGHVLKGLEGKILPDAIRGE